MAQILIVDDQPDIQLLLQTYLQAADHTVRLAGDGLEAMVWLEQSDCDLILLDIHLPGCSGLEWLQQIKADARYRQIPVIMITAHTESTLLEQAFAQGAVDFIRKPLQKVEILARVGNSLTLQRQYQQIDSLYQELQQDLELAGQLQSCFLPQQLPVQPDIHFAARYFPYLPVGGDLYGVHSLDPQTYLAYLGDISGHGIQPAMLMSALKVSLDHLLAQSDLPRTPWRLLQALQAEMAPFFRRHYLTLATALICLNPDPVADSAGRLLLYNAGHPPPLLIRAGRCSPLKTSGAMPVGLQDLQDYGPGQQLEISLQAGDRLIFFSDGLFEHPAPGVWGYPQLLARLKHFPWEQTPTAALPESLASWIFDAEHPAPEDDYSLLVCEVAPLRSAQQTLLLTPASLENFGKQLKVLAMRQGASLVQAEQMQLCWLEYAHNLLQHSLYAGQPVSVSLSPTDTGLCLEIRDQAPAWQARVSHTPMVQIPAEQSHGRGLALIEALSQRLCLAHIGGQNLAHMYF